MNATQHAAPNWRASHAPSGTGSAIAHTAAVMAALIALLAIGGWAFAGTNGLYAMIVVGLIINFASYWFSDRLALRAHRAQPVSREEAPRLYQIVEGLARKADLPAPPIYIIPSPAANAFATGRGPKHAAVAVTAGILEVLDDRELEGVLAHEMSHVLNRDVLTATIAAGIAGVISAIGYALQFGAMFGGLGGGDRDRRGSPLAALAWIIVAPLIAMLLQLALSRTREYAADASGARLTGDPEGLARALGRLEGASQVIPYDNAGPATAHLFIINPLRGRNFRKLLSTHPPIADRIERLRAMTA